MTLFKGYTLQLESIREMRQDIEPLHRRHYAETEDRYLHHPFALDYGGFGALEETGGFLCYTAREVASGAMVAYLMYFVTRSMHFTGSVAQEDAYFVVPEHRGTGLARQLLRFAETDVAKRGVAYAFMSSKKPVGGPDISLLLGTEGYSEVARVFCKKLEK